ncbi:MAG: hypothetical protein KDC92_17695, partial [Bacteroidetes bacterium]|nr:hypothetical protein [Bacteroidota bacterium]
LFDLLHGMPENINWDDESTDLDFLGSFHPDKNHFEINREKLESRLNPNAAWWIFTKKGEPKSANRFSANEARGILRSLGYVDSKVSAINDEWTATKFKLRKP